MTLIDSRFSYGSSPKENTWRAIDDIRDVYGIYRLTLDDKSHTIHVEYDASRLTEGDLAALLRSAGIDVREQVWDA
jgi:hypothetical protein